MWLVGEGGESETIVPDSKARSFAQGVLGSEGASTPSVVVNMGGFDISVSGGGGADNINAIINTITAKIKSETIEGVRLALASANTAKRNAMRAV